MEIFDQYTTSYANYIIPTEMELLDFGTSQAHNTNPEIGILNDLEKIMENTKRILSGYFGKSGVSIKHFIDYDGLIKTTDPYKKAHLREYLIIDLIRIIISMHILDLYCEVPEYMPEEHLDWVWKIWYGDFSEDIQSGEIKWNVDFLDLNYLQKLKKPSVGGFIKEEEIIAYYNKRVSPNYQMVFKEKFGKIQLKNPTKANFKTILEIDHQQIDFSEIKAKTSSLNGDVYVVIKEKKMYDSTGKSIDLF